jgi:hypothetical protein
MATKKNSGGLSGAAINRENLDPIWWHGVTIYTVPRAIANDRSKVTDPDLISKAVTEIVNYD